MVPSLVFETGQGWDDSSFYLVEEGWDQSISCLVWGHQKWDHPPTDGDCLSVLFLGRV
jgi:hypothetical protein